MTVWNWKAICEKELGFNMDNKVVLDSILLLNKSFESTMGNHRQEEE